MYVVISILTFGGIMYFLRKSDMGFPVEFREMCSEEPFLGGMFIFIALLVGWLWPAFLALGAVALPLYAVAKWMGRDE